MSKIEMRGVIVPSEYDSDWTQEWIEKGLITPESTFRRAVRDAADNEPLSIYIDSPGGSVFSAFEMLNELTAWQAETGQPVNITVGGMAASAAAAITVMSGASVSVNRNSKLMFHGASSGLIAQEGGFRDEADLLAKINDDMKVVLVNRYGIDADLVNQWFADGRAGWLNAEEALGYGIADVVLDSDAMKAVYEDADVEAMAGRGLKIAAFADLAENEQLPVDEQDDEQENDDEASQDDTDDDSGEPDESTEDEGGNDDESDADESDEDAPSDAWQEGYDAGCRETRSQVMLEVAEQLQEAQAGSAESAKVITAYEQALRDKQEQCDNEVQRVRKQLAEMESRLQSLVPGFRATDEQTATTPQTSGDYDSLVQAKIDEGMSKNEAIAFVTDNHPQAHKAWLEQKRKQGQ